jgi:hypothetical protein
MLSPVELLTFNVLFVVLTTSLLRKFDAAITVFPITNDSAFSLVPQNLFLLIPDKSKSSLDNVIPCLIDSNPASVDLGVNCSLLKIATRLSSINIVITIFCKFVARSMISSTFKPVELAWLN